MRLLSAIGTPQKQATLGNRSDNADSIPNPYKTLAKMRLLSASGTHEKQATLGNRSENANFECQHCKTAAIMQTLYPTLIKPLRKCDF